MDEIIAQPNFWDDPKKSAEILNERKMLKSKIERVGNLKKHIDGNLELLGALKEENDTEMQELISLEVDDIMEELNQLELLLLLSGEFDPFHAIVEIHPGAGGTEACDWANMLYRMCLRFCEKKNYQVEILEEQSAEEAGIKSVTFIVKGENAFGYLKCEKGVHRLVRISPFDSGARRHTSFASIDVTPMLEQDKIQVEIKESDLKIDVYRSSGAGGQHVNTTDSAVRITHLPTKTVVTCQNERSQIQNREKALEILKNKLYQLEVAKREENLKKMKGTVSAIDFGSQIRSYVMHPYSLVKDHRTNVEETNVNKVLDGELDQFISAVLKKGIM